MTTHSVRTIQKRALKANHHLQSQQRMQAAQRALDYLSDNKHLSIPSEKGPCIWNFGFGANINPWKLEQKRNIHPIGEKLRGKLMGWRLLFDHKGGFGNIINMETESDGLSKNIFDPFMSDGGEYEVHGILLKLTHDDFIKLAHMEHEYELHQVSIRIYQEDLIKTTTRDDFNGHSSVTAVVFKSPRCFQTKRSDLYPTSRYIELIQKGAKQMKIENEYCQWLSQIYSIDGCNRGSEYYDLRQKSETNMKSFNDNK